MELKQVKAVVDIVIARPLSYAIYGLVLASGYLARGTIAIAGRLRQRWSARRTA